MENQNFQEFKDYITTNAKRLKACSDEYKRALSSTNYQELLKVVVDNGNWCYNNKLVNADVLKKYVPDAELLEANIYVEKQNVIQKDSLAHYYSSTSEHYDSSYASVYKLNNRELNDKVIIRERSTDKVYCKKDAFTIIQIS